MEEPLITSIPQPFLRDYLQKTGEHFVGLERIFFGKNNRSYHVRTLGHSYFLKVYFRHPHDTRDRLGAEYAFLEFCRDQGIGGVPLPLASDWESGMALYSWIDGAPVKKGQVSSEDIKSAAALLGALALCSSVPQAAKLPFAADACTSAWDHMVLAQRRVEALSTALMAAQTNPIVLQARDFAVKGLVPALNSVMSMAQSLIEPDALRQPLCHHDFIVSPSDFGFHNALRIQDGVVFVDFEYAGRDDPVKTVCDFVCQPEIPVEEDELETMTDSLETFDAKKILQRAKMLLPLHRIKWCCIILNDFIKLHALRREFSNEENSGADKLEIQMHKAQSYADMHGVFK
ncbi:MAG: phosphotransferase [Desulfovibrio sp.]|uniref:phosphotransferase n=1 Tax=Desulfovibrio sp. TaxID=885 RepID=UPI00135E597D|nr:phosphotransferase [Desulfovibrio sp.]MTJ92995.1 phosphotransferase [Desulfovibrio sp.]